MKTRIKLLISLLVFLGICVVSRVTWHLIPVTAKAKSIRTVSWDGSYSTYDRLADLLKIGMTDKEVRAILGKAEIENVLIDGHRWIYGETEATTGWVCIVDFTLDEGTNRLRYFCNIEHVLFPTSSHREFGTPVDGGKFDGLLGLQLYREKSQMQKPTRK